MAMHIAAELSSTPIHGFPKELSGGQRHSLRGRIHRGIRRVLDDVKCVKENPQGMRRICQASVSESVRREQVAEFIVDLRLWHGHPGQQRDARNDCDCADGQHGEAFVLREGGKFAFAPSNKRLAEARDGATPERYIPLQ